MKRKLRVLFFLLFPILWAYITWIKPYARHKEKHDKVKTYQKARKLILKVNKALILDYHVEGLENLIPGENYLFVANHQSAFDPLAFLTILKDFPTTFVAKKEVEKLPIVPSFLKDIGGLTMDRDDLKQSLRVMMKVEDELRNKTRSWLIFPEGTRNKENHDELLAFHHGTFRPAVKANVAIVPIAIYGTFRAVKFKLHLKRYPIFIKINKPFTPSEYKDLTTNEIAERMQKAVQDSITDSLIAKDKEYNERVNIKYIKNLK